MSKNVKVAIRIRPIFDNDGSENDVSVVDILENQTTLSLTNSKIYNGLKESILNSVTLKYHTCIFAYGQSATGKTYTMMGNELEDGLIPRICQEIFKHVKRTSDSINISTSYLEIYNEKVHDLLANEKDRKIQLKVREHPENGPYVPGLIEQHVFTSNELLACLTKGNKNRTVAATLHNRESSRSHSVFIIKCQSTLSVDSVFYLYMIDLAGSEKTVSKHLLKEGANINKSLVSLSNVITALAVSPSQSNYSETLHTLRFGQRVKKLKSSPKINENPTLKLIKELRDENYQLKILLSKFADKYKVNDEGIQTNIGTITENVPTSETKLSFRKNLMTPDIITHHKLNFEIEKYPKTNVEIISSDVLEYDVIFEKISSFCSLKYAEKNCNLMAEKNRILIQCLANVEDSTAKTALIEYFENAFELIGHLKMAANYLGVDNKMSLL